MDPIWPPFECGSNKDPLFDAAVPFISLYAICYFMPLRTPAREDQFDYGHDDCNFIICAAINRERQAAAIKNGAPQSAIFYGEQHLS